MVQTLIVLAIVLAAAVYLGAKFYRTARAASSKDDGCGAGCGCEPQHRAPSAQHPA